MKYNKTTISPFLAKVTLGLELAYTKKLIDKSEIVNYLQEYQNHLINEKELFLSVSISECTIVLSGQIEPHLKLNFINYPKFPLQESILKNEIEKLTKCLMEKFEQNRVIIEYLDETVMFENSKLIDPRIKRRLTN